MVVVSVENMCDYKKCISYALKGGGKNYLGNEIPIFDSIESFIDIYRTEGLYDDDGNCLWEEDGYPDWVVEKIAKERMKKLVKTGVSIPFVVVMDGEKGYDRLGSVSIEVFSEINITEAKGLYDDVL